MYKNKTILAWFNLFSNLRFYYPFSIIYYYKICGSYSLAMSVFSVAILSSAFMEIPTGIFSDLVGRKKTILLGLISSVISLIIFALANSYLILFFASIFEGLSKSLYSGNNEAFIYDSLEQKSDDKYYIIFGKLSSVSKASLAISGLLGGIIAPKSLSFLFWISAVFQIIAICFCLFLKESAIKRADKNVLIHFKQSVHYFLNNKQIRLLSMADVIGYGIGEASWMFRSIFINMVWPIWAVGIPQVISDLGATISFYTSGKFIEKFGEEKLLLIGNLYGRFSDIFALLSANIFSPLVMTSSSIFFGIGTVSKTNLLQKEFSNNQRATLGSIISFFGSVFFGIYAIILGIFADKLGPVNTLIISNILLFSVVWLYFKVYQDKHY